MLIQSLHGRCLIVHCRQPPPLHLESDLWELALLLGADLLTLVVETESMLHVDVGGGGVTFILDKIHLTCPAVSISKYRHIVLHF